jgi:hypothetical protein
VTDVLACSGLGAGWTGDRILTLHVKTGRTSDKMAYCKKRREVDARTIHEHSSTPPIYCFEYCRKINWPATEMPNHYALCR